MTRSLVRFVARRNLWHTVGTQRWLGTAHDAYKRLFAQSAYTQYSNSKDGTAQHHQRYNPAERLDAQFWQEKADAFERLTRRKQRADLREECGLSRRSITALCVSCHWACTVSC